MNPNPFFLFFLNSKIFFLRKYASQRPAMKPGKSGGKNFLSYGYAHCKSLSKMLISHTYSPCTLNDFHSAGKLHRVQAPLSFPLFLHSLICVLSQLLAGDKTDFFHRKCMKADSKCCQYSGKEDLRGSEFRINAAAYFSALPRQSIKKLHLAQKWHHVSRLFADVPFKVSLVTVALNGLSSHV